MRQRERERRSQVAAAQAARRQQNPDVCEGRDSSWVEEMGLFFSFPVPNPTK